MPLRLMQVLQLRLVPVEKLRVGSERRRGRSRLRVAHEALRLRDRDRRDEVVAHRKTGAADGVRDRWIVLEMHAAGVVGGYLRAAAGIVDLLVQIRRGLRIALAQRLEAVRRRDE